jgi:hypothetical protein
MNAFPLMSITNRYLRHTLILRETRLVDVPTSGRKIRHELPKHQDTNCNLGNRICIMEYSDDIFIYLTKLTE